MGRNLAAQVTPRILGVGTNAPREYPSYPLRQASFRICLRSPRDRGHWPEAGRNAWTLQAGRHRLGGRQMDRQFPGAHEFAARCCQDLLFHPLRSLPSIGPGATRGRTNRPSQKSPTEIHAWSHTRTSPVQVALSEPEAFSDKDFASKF